LLPPVDLPMDFEPISRAKVTPTPVRPETLHRGRLLDWLDGHARRRLSLVVADAGYGKTTLVAD
jgi:ATP/maltotriose-dependent transcriptional regulator MalT